MYRYKVLNKSDGVATKKAVKNRVHVSRKNKKKGMKDNTFDHNSSIYI
jgi:hypothetical protein